MNIVRWSATALLALAIVFGGCASTYPPPTEADRQVDTSRLPYLIGPGDTIRVDVWRSPELSVTVPVRPGPPMLDGMGRRLRAQRLPWRIWMVTVIMTCWLVRVMV